ncbi:3'(2'),5'-bisphosphate nucleotidase CysQ [Maribacter sp. HTCC2170]|uniref:3'(2'),5'-bisphosphate nucleotidase CysQ n=1 Tax=Maribacter sp. (strain HTCC2170 / KCCM 42371) TaxID=313603 RepID=UPI00006BD5DA|nr:3'(2'),5'-bisphosphate nucleotidase CysQ [Maribacter sp. HTCC2170]EAR02535.1 CysQ, sulfite synthesis pathway protein [Maribacter sp. HTCC2170]
MNNYLRIALKSAVEAGKEILKIYENEFEISIKEDKSPLTEADIASSDIINSYLKPTGFHIISEEIRNLEFDIRKDWKTCWIVDPLDGTKEFIKRNGEFTVNIALVENGIPKMGVIYVPVTRELYYADVSKGKAYKTLLNNAHETDGSYFNDNDLITPIEDDKEMIKVVGSRSHMNKDTLKFIEELKNEYRGIDIVSKGSSLKFCLVAEGKADIYPRLAPTMEWDTAAGHAICSAVGLTVISKETNKELAYNKKDLLNSHFIVKK